MQTAVTTFQRRRKIIKAGEQDDDDELQTVELHAQLHFGEASYYEYYSSDEFYSRRGGGGGSNLVRRTLRLIGRRGIAFPSFY